jgi:hypothetical protein
MRKPEAWLIAMFLLAGCAETRSRTVPMLIQRNDCVMYEVATSWDAKACWVDCYDNQGQKTNHDLCTVQPPAAVLGGLVPMLTSTSAIGAATTAVMK